ncbi:MAG: hypothetical protein AABX04_04115 [Nanoarchaeota archaeon]
MGKRKHLNQVEALIAKSPVISFKSIQKIVKNHQYTKQLIRNLIKQEKLEILTKGYYTTHDDISLAVFCFQPAYLGLQDALSYHGMWEQETIPIIITTKRIRTGLRRVMGNNVLIRRIDKKYFWGVEHQEQNHFALPYSDLEKTFLDMVYFNEKTNKETLNEIIKKMDKKKLSYYLKVYPKKFQEKIKHHLTPKHL